MIVKLNDKQKERLATLFNQRQMIENEINNTLILYAEAKTNKEIKEVEVSKDLNIISINPKKEKENE